jgi:hypothetical protein
LITNGTRLRSQVCDTQVIVVRSASNLDELRAGGAPMVPLDASQSGDAPALDPSFAEGTVLGKRYVGAGGAEVLVTKAGVGSLSLGDAPMAVKQASPLPASD